MNNPREVFEILKMPPTPPLEEVSEDDRERNGSVYVSNQANQEDRLRVD